MPMPFESPIGIHVQIHWFGQPLSEHNVDGSSDENPIMHSFPLSMRRSSNLLGRRLDLGVGGEGIIGRTISIVDDRKRLLGQGIIGRI